MTNDDTVTYNLNLNRIYKDFVKKNGQNSYSNESWDFLALILSFFGVQSSGKRFFIKWHREDSLQMTFLLNLLTKLIQGNILATYNNQEKTWTLLLR
jgi:hypothetical protein